MLPPFIIDQIRRREAEENALHDLPQPMLELPIHPPEVSGVRDGGDSTPPRGWVIIDLAGVATSI